jgi:hypothetical protein
MKKMLALALAALLVMSCVPALAVSRDFSSVRVTEVMASNGESLKDSAGESPDWIELKNISAEDIDLEGLCLSDGKKNLKKFVFPANVTLPAGGYMVIFASDEEKIITLEDGTVEIHVAFKLSAAGEKVVLSYQDVILDMVRFDQQQKDVSFGRKADDTWAFCSEPTPGADNLFD